MKNSVDPTDNLRKDTTWITVGWVLLALSLVVPLLIFLVVILTHLDEFKPLHVPLNSRFVVVATASAAIIGLIVLFFLLRNQRQKDAAFQVTRRELERTRAELGESQRQLDAVRQELAITRGEIDELRTRSVSRPSIAAVQGFDKLPSAEYLALLQTLFSSRPDVKYLHVSPLSGGHGGSMTVLVGLQHDQSKSLESKSYVVKLGERGEMDGELARIEKHVKTTPMRAPIVFGYSPWESYAGTAYEFAQLEPDGAISSFHTVYSRPSGQVVDLVAKVFHHLGGAWYEKGQVELVSLNDEYWLLAKKQPSIIAAIDAILEPKDSYRQNFAGAEGNLRPNLKPSFCPATVDDWHDPVAFLRNWRRSRPKVTVHRAVVHGDLNAQNILIEEGRSGDKGVWFIDFSHTGNGLSDERTRERQLDGVQLDPERGHTLRDFCRLEADIKFILTKLKTPQDLQRAVAFEKELIRCGLDLYDLSVATLPSGFPIEDDQFRKAWQVIREIRGQAAVYLPNKNDLQPFYFSLLNATLPIVYYQSDQFANEVSEKLQKRYALLAAGMACAQI